MSPTSSNRPADNSLLGQLHEGAGNYDEAFAAFERMNAIARADPSQPGAARRRLPRP